MTFVRIPAGTSTIGSSSTDTYAKNDEKSFLVRISNDFFMQTTEVTQAQFQAIMGINPSKFSGCGPDCPVENIDWNTVHKFIEALNKKTATEGFSYRLPTEAEWEYAARAGSNKSLPGGDLVSKGCSELDTLLDKVAWYCANSDKKTRPSSRKKPNAFGLYDMLGNVMEWCQDKYGAYPDKTSAITDYISASSSRNRVLRGGGWNSPAEDCRLSARFSAGPGRDNNETGFRLVAMPTKK